LLGRPIGQSGSGPTLWALYPSGEAAGEAAADVRAALSEGRLTTPGDGLPAILATTIATAPAAGAPPAAAPPAAQPARPTEEP
jgi:hypothetical protein